MKVNVRPSWRHANASASSLEELRYELRRAGLLYHTVSVAWLVRQQTASVMVILRKPLHSPEALFLAESVMSFLRLRKVIL